MKTNEKKEPKNLENSALSVVIIVAILVHVTLNIYAWMSDFSFLHLLMLTASAVALLGIVIGIYSLEKKYTNPKNYSSKWYI